MKQISKILIAIVILTNLTFGLDPLGFLLDPIKTTFKSTKSYLKLGVTVNNYANAALTDSQIYNSYGSLATPENTVYRKQTYSIYYSFYPIKSVRTSFSANLTPDFIDGYGNLDKSFSYNYSLSFDYKLSRSISLTSRYSKNNAEYYYDLEKYGKDTDLQKYRQTDSIYFGISIR